jgi:hypothetical protein
MKEMVLAAFVAATLTAGIASAGIASLADGAAVLINASSHSDPHDNATNSLGGPSQPRMLSASANLPLVR